MNCACAESIAALGPKFAPLSANVAAMGKVEPQGSAKSALAGALSAESALSAATSASALAGANVPLSASAMSKLTSLASGVGALEGALQMPLTSASCEASLEQLTGAVADGGFSDALAALPLSTLPSLKAMADHASATSAASDLGVSLSSPDAAAELSALAEASADAAAEASAKAAAEASGGASGSAGASGSGSAQSSANAAAFVSMSSAVQSSLGVNLGAPGGVAQLGAKLETLNGNLPALNSLAGELDPGLLSKAIGLLDALASIQSSLGVNLLTPGAGFQVQPKLAELSKSAGASKSLGASKSVEAAKSVAGSKSKSVSKAAQYAYQEGLGNVLGSLPVLPQPTLLFAYLVGKLGAVGVPLVQHAPCGPGCLVKAEPCPFGPADFSKEIAQESAKLQAPKAAFEASQAAAASAPPAGAPSLAGAASGAATGATAGAASGAAASASTAAASGAAKGKGTAS